MISRSSSFEAGGIGESSLVISRNFLKVPSSKTARALEPPNCCELAAVVNACWPIGFFSEDSPEDMLLLVEFGLIWDGCEGLWLEVSSLLGE